MAQSSSGDRPRRISGCGALSADNVVRKPMDPMDPAGGSYDMAMTDTDYVKKTFDFGTFMEDLGPKVDKWRDSRDGAEKELLEKEIKTLLHAKAGVRTIQRRTSVCARTALDSPRRTGGIVNYNGRQSAATKKYLREQHHTVNPALMDNQMHLLKDTRVNKWLNEEFRDTTQKQDLFWQRMNQVRSVAKTGVPGTKKKFVEIVMSLVQKERSKASAEARNVRERLINSIMDPTTIALLDHANKGGIKKTYNLDMFDFAANLGATKSPLVITAHFCLARLGVLDVLPVQTKKLVGWLIGIQAGYNDLPYHNYLHGADVAWTMFSWFQVDKFKKCFTELDMLVAILSAAAHDVGHNGLNNAFHVATQSDLAFLYNDMSVMENYHLSIALKLLKARENNFVEDFTKEAKTYFRSTMIRLILSTDMQHHTALIKELSVGPQSTPLTALQILKTGLHLADISNPTKEPQVAVEWSIRCQEEFWRQGDAEKKAGVPVGAMMDRDSDFEGAQMGFITYIVKPSFNFWMGWLRSDELRAAVAHNLQDNFQYWKESKEKKQAKVRSMMRQESEPNLKREAEKTPEKKEDSP